MLTELIRRPTRNNRGIRTWLPATLYLLTAAAAAAGPGREPLPTQHMREEVRDAKPVGALAAGKILHFDMLLSLRAPDQLERFLAAAYDPASPSYRRFVTPGEFTARFGPSQATWNELVEFARRNGFTILGGSRDEMDLRLAGTVRAVEAAFQVRMRVYEHPREGRTYYSPDTEPTVDMQSVVWHISGLDNFSTPVPRVHAHPNVSVRPLTATGACPGNSYCGSDMRTAYYGGNALTGSGQSVGLVEFFGYETSDLDRYFRTSGGTNLVPVTAVSTDGSAVGCVSAAGCDDTEQVLDITQALGMAPGLAQVNVYVGATDTAILSAMSVPHAGSITGKVDAQLSCSWGWGPADPATDDPLFKKFAAQGQSFFTAAGDSAAYTPASQYVYPADDANVTVVGGSDLSTTGPAGAWLAETAWSDGGGGFVAAHNIPIPAWQTAAIAGFNAHSSKPGSTLWRNAPDVAGEANFDFYVCADQQACTAGYGGTSFAAPMWAGYMALVNQQSSLRGQSPLGFVNAALYALGNASGSGYAGAFHDISAGGNGYAAQAGYDLATGWGSPNGAGLIAALVGSVAPGFTLSAGSLSMAAGGAGTTTLTSAAVGGFNSAIALTVSGQPAGVTAVLSAASIAASGVVTLHVTAASTAAAGSYPLVITGVGGNLTKKVTVTLVVTSVAKPTFTVGLNSTALSAVRGQSRSYSLQTAATGSPVPVITLSVSGLPAGVTARFSPATINGSGSSTVTLTAGPNAVRATTSARFSGTAAAITHTVTVTLRVN